MVSCCGIALSALDAKKAEEAMKKAEVTAAPVQQEVLPEAEKGEAL